MIIIMILLFFSENELLDLMWIWKKNFGNRFNLV